MNLQNRRQCRLNRLVDDWQVVAFDEKLMDGIRNAESNRILGGRCYADAGKPAIKAIGADALTDDL